MPERYCREIGVAADKKCENAPSQGLRQHEPLAVIPAAKADSRFDPFEQSPSEADLNRIGSRRPEQAGQEIPLMCSSSVICHGPAAAYRLQGYSGIESWKNRREGMAISAVKKFRPNQQPVNALAKEQCDVWYTRYFSGGRRHRELDKF
jgi:hypothetical protein